MNDLINISLPTAGGYALLGYGVVFFGLVLLMCVVLVMGKIMTRKKAAPAAAAAAEAPAAAPAPAVTAPPAPGTAGDFKRYNSDPRDAAMVMAMVADSLGKPINELRFISIREVTEDEV